MRLRLGLRRWPAPIISHFSGDLDEHQLLAPAGVDNDTANVNIRCEGLFFAGQSRLSANQSDRAIALFKKLLDIKAIDVCDHTIAIVELRRLGLDLLPKKEEEPIDMHSGGQ